MTKRNPAYLLIGAPLKGWRSGNNLDKNYIGGGIILRKKILALADKKRAAYITEGKTPEEADQLVQELWVRKCYGSGTFGKITEFISPAGIKELIKAGELITPEQAKLSTLPPGWRSGHDLKKDYVGEHRKFQRIIRALGSRKRAAYITEGKTFKEADRLIQEHWVRRCYGSSNGGHITEFISPEGIRELAEAKELLTPEQVKQLNPPKGWRSGNGLSKDYIGSNVTLREKILTLANKKRDAYLAAGKTPEEAGQLVQELWVRKYYSHGSNGHITEFISPEGIRELAEAKELLTPEQVKQLNPPKGWRSGNSLSKDYIGDYRKLGEKILTLANKKRDAYLAAGKTPEEAAQLVQELWVRKYYSHGSNGHIAEFVSPAGIAELIATKELLTPAEAKKLIPSQGWRSGAGLSEDYIGGSIKFRRIIVTFGLRKKAALITEGKNQEEADRLVHEHWVRKCYGSRTCGPITECVSPRGIEELIEQGILKPRYKPAPYSIASLLASGMSEDETRITLNLSKTAFATAREAIARALAENGGADLAAYKAELAHNRKIRREDFMAAVQSHGSIEDAAHHLGLSPQRVMARLGRYWKLDVALLDKLDQPAIHMDMALRVDFTQLPRTSPAATWFAVKQLHGELHQAPNLNQIAEKLKIKRGLVDKNVHFLIACDSLRREDLTREEEASSFSPSAIGFAIRQHHGRGCLFR
ncbi:MAG: hypothetical protein AB7G80_09745 [Dongiaceae bacterium]